MSQILSQVVGQRMRQEQRLTAQLIQAMDILQLNALALESRIQQEIDGNPALELNDESDYADAGPAQEPERSDGEQTAVVAENEAAPEEFERLDNLVTEYDYIDDEGGRPSRSFAGLAEESQAKLDAMANTAARPIGLQEHLLDQWRMLDAPDELRPLGEAIINHVDDIGRLATPLDEIATRITPTPTIEQMEDALFYVQELDPPGVAARDVRECLMLQLELLPGDNRLPMAIVRDHYDELQRNHLPQIAKVLGVSLDEVKTALGVIARLSLHPGAEISHTSAPRVTPDVIVTYDEDSDSYDVRLTRPNQRELRISPEFRRALQTAGKDKAARQFVRQKIEQANSIIDAVNFRRHRLLDVVQAVVEAQREFLEKGEGHIRVLRMSDLADRFGCDPSTISRTVDDKYVDTPQGIFPLRRFFTGGAETSSGDALGWDSIKAKVQEIIAAENKASPLSDDAVVKQLQQRGIEIKRRTVAKYRDQLGIPTARQRRQY